AQGPLWVQADIGTSLCDVRFTPESGQLIVGDDGEQTAVQHADLFAQHSANDQWRFDECGDVKKDLDQLLIWASNFVACPP
ncbi:MAG: hypothetical protein WCB26_21845, partial [Pseudolabrys sp.]